MNFPVLPWQSPLTVRFQCGLERTFSSVYEALDFLENEWPVRRGARYGLAVKLCRRALNRAVPAAVAREAFVAACLEAGLPVAAALPAWSIPSAKGTTETVPLGRSGTGTSFAVRQQGPAIAGFEP